MHLLFLLFTILSVAFGAVLPGVAITEGNVTDATGGDGDHHYFTLYTDTEYRGTYWDEEKYMAANKVCWTISADANGVNSIKIHPTQLHPRIKCRITLYAYRCDIASNFYVDIVTDVPDLGAYTHTQDWDTADKAVQCWFDHGNF